MIRGPPNPPSFPTRRSSDLYRPVSTSAFRWSIKAGAFFPPISLENTEIGWTSPWTLTPSAINAWVGEELRTIGLEGRSEEHTSELQSLRHLVCRLLLEKKKL